MISLKMNVSYHGHGAFMVWHFIFLFKRYLYVKFTIVKELSIRKMLNACGCVFKIRVSKECMNFRIWKYLPVNVSMCNNSFRYFRDQQNIQLIQMLTRTSLLKYVDSDAVTVIKSYFMLQILLWLFNNNGKNHEKHTQPVFCFIYLFIYLNIH